MNILELEIQRKEKELEDLKAKLKSEFSILDSPEDLAEYLHSKLCHWNHIDGCSWTYDNNWDISPRKEYLNRAVKILDLLGFTCGCISDTSKIKLVKAILGTD